MCRYHGIFDNICLTMDSATALSVGLFLGLSDVRELKNKKAF